MAPEQAQARRGEIGRATDVYGLGAVLYKVLTGRPPFGGENDLEILRRVVEQDPVPPRLRRPGVPIDLDTICLKCLEKRPDRRYPTAAALADDLERFLEGKPIAARPLPAWERAGRWARRNPVTAVLASGVVLIILAVQVGLIWFNATLSRLNSELRTALENDRAKGIELRKERDLADRQARLLRRQLAGHRLLEVQQAAVGKDLEQAQRLLNQSVPDEDAAWRAGFPHAYLRRYVRDRFVAFAGHDSPINTLVMAPDGRSLASGDDRGIIRLWDLDSEQSRTLAVPGQRQMRHLDFSPDDRILAAIQGAPQCVRLWDVASGRLLTDLDGEGHLYTARVLFRADGRGLVGIRGRIPPDGSPCDVFDLSPGAPGSAPVAVQVDPARAASEVRDERLESLIRGMEGRGGDRPASRSEFEQSWQTRPPWGVAYTRDRRLVVLAGGDGTFDVHGIKTGLVIALGQVRPEGSAIVRFYPSKKVYPPVPLEEERIRRLVAFLMPDSPGATNRAEPGREIETTGTAAFRPDRAAVAVWEENQDRLDIIHLADRGKSTRIDQSPLNDQRTMVYTPDGRTLMLGGDDGIIRLWHLRPRTNPKVVPGHYPLEAWAVAFLSDGRTIATSGDDSQIRLWDGRTGRWKKTLSAHKSLVTSLASSPDGRTLVSGSFHARSPVIVWDVEAGTPRFVLHGHERVVRAVALSPDGRTAASGGDDHYLMIWDVASGKLNRRVDLVARTFALAFSPDGHTLAWGGQDHRIILTDPSTGRVRSITAPNDVFALLFSRDGALLYSAHIDGTVFAWDYVKGEKVRTLPGHGRTVRGLALSPDGETLSTAGDDETVRLCDAVTGQQLLVLTDCRARVNAVAFSPDGRTLAAVDHAGMLRLWDAAPRPGLIPP
jgi:WD40 repeat protein